MQAKQSRGEHVFSRAAWLDTVQNCDCCPPPSFFLKCPVQRLPNQFLSGTGTLLLDSGVCLNISICASLSLGDCPSLDASVSVLCLFLTVL